MPTSTAPLVLATIVLSLLSAAPGSAAAADPAATSLGSVSSVTEEQGSPTAEPTAVRGIWRWPLSPEPAVLRPFVPPPTPYAAGHRGADLAAVPGDVVRAVAPGRVTHVGPVAGQGTVTVLHADGLSSTYEPVAGVVSVGDVVAAGSELGTLSGGSHCTGSCLHLGARRDGQPPTYLDPLRLISGGPVILLPL